jgi:hypothetical protein
MRIRIIGTHEHSAHSWYAGHLGEEFEVLDFKPGKPGFPGVYVVGTTALCAQGRLSERVGYVRVSDAAIVS